MSTIFKKIPLSELGKLEKQLAKQFRPAALRALKAAQGPIISELKKQRTGLEEQLAEAEAEFEMRLNGASYEEVARAALAAIGADAQ